MRHVARIDPLPGLWITEITASAFQHLPEYSLTFPMTSPARLGPLRSSRPVAATSTTMSMSRERNRHTGCSVMCTANQSLLRATSRNTSHEAAAGAPSISSGGG